MTKMLENVEGNLAEVNSAALRHYYLNNHCPEGMTTPDDIYQHLLLDVNASPKIKTTRLLEAIGSLQLYINRILTNQEVDPHVGNLGNLKTYWETGKYYRYWEANKMIEAYPSRYIEPGVFSGASDAYQLFETDLAKGELTEKALQNALNTYIKNFNEALDIETIWVTTESDGLGNIGSAFKPSYSYHLGCKRGQTETLYLRKVKHSDSDGTPIDYGAWHKIDITLTTSPSDLLGISVFKVSRRLYLFTFEKEKIFKKKSGSDELIESDEYNLIIKHSSEDAQGNWSEMYPVERFPWRGPAIDSRGRPKEEADLDFRLLGTIAQASNEDLGGILFKLRESDECPHVFTIKKNEPFISVLRQTDWRDVYPGVEDAVCEFTPRTIGSGARELFQAIYKKGRLAPNRSENEISQYLVCRDQSDSSNDWVAEAVYAPSLRDSVLYARYKEVAAIQQYDLPACYVEGATLGKTTFSKVKYSQKTSDKFRGPFGRYFWELFFYIPLTVATRYKQAGQFEEAAIWFGYLYDPSYAKGDDRQWPVLALKGEADFSMSTLSIVDPDEMAREHPFYYKKLVFRLYIQTLIERGDGLYRQLSRESLREAKVWYMMAKNIMGTKPVVSVAQTSPLPNLGEVGEGDTEFLAPVDKSFLELWDLISTRLDCLRKNLSLEGKPLDLPLLSTRVDPRKLTASVRDSRGTVRSALTQVKTYPHYRYAVLRDITNGYLSQLMNLGQRLQSALEQYDSAKLIQQQTNHHRELASLATNIQVEQYNLQKKNIETWDIQRQGIKQRISYYGDLLEAGLSDLEQTSIGLNIASGALGAASSYVAAVGSALTLAPNVFGLAVGGMNYAAVPYALSGVLGAVANATGTASSVTGLYAGYERRAQEWLQQKEQAQYELALLDKNEASAQEQLNIADKELERQKTQIAFLDMEIRILENRFTNPQMYNWLSGRLKQMFYQVYGNVLSLCVQTEAAFQLETGEFQSQFIGRSHWNSASSGLLCAEALQADMQRMDTWYLTRKQRDLEIHKTFSLKQLNADIIKELKDLGRCTFNLSEDDFDSDYPSHYMRQIKTVSLSFPAVLQPYQNIGATLTQIRNCLYTDKSKAKGIENIRSSQQIAVSQGLDDSGLFQLDFNDQRYLPFEGTGVESSWELEFPALSGEGRGNSDVRHLLENLTDVIVHIRYTAKH
ncbi:neuraminidase-like domain-containing protein [Vibrio navarrensis]|uniref:Tc toxin subunit A-related protein n=1 Tax=Vibrio navarrensis TaxID=29495 RepID=UPI001558A0BA|nr:neuraminidase-like domain-containing protein [Vibrio navarrensis]